jgi:hypothetical protein
MGWLYRSRKRCGAILIYVSGVDMWRRGPGAANSGVTTNFAAT